LVPSKPKKKKAVPLPPDDAALVIAGRHYCECAATRHRLLGNCLRCGHIWCEQEGRGMCLYCKQVAAAERAAEKADKSAAKSTDKSSEKLEADQRKAEEQRDRLIEFDRSSAARTVVLGAPPPPPPPSFDPLTD
jgi:hypothetical protein